jgi:type IV conjugative transfer system coupling protein TraD
MRQCGKRQKQTDITKGQKLVTVTELKKTLTKTKLASDLRIAGLPLVKNRELQHILVSGTTGSGKSNLFNILLPQIRSRPNKAIIVDVTGEYIAKFYNPATDFIFNPLDKRSINWNIWQDCQHESHYEAFATSIIPSKKYQSDDIWDASSRVVLVEVLKKLAAAKEQSIKKLISIISTSKIKDLEKYLQGTAAAKIISTQGDKTTLSVLMTLTTQIAPLKLIEDSSDNFSIRNWITSETNQNSWLFISARTDQIEALRSLLSAFSDTTLNALLSLTPDNKRRIWFIVDELAKLNKLTSLPSALAESRKYGGCIAMGIQSISQLTENYGPNLSSSIVDMCSSFFFFRSSNPQTAEWIAKILGIVEQEELHEQLSYGASTIKDGVSFSKQTKSKQLVLPIEIANLPDLTAYVKYAGFDITKIKTEYQALPTNHLGFELKVK